MKRVLKNWIFRETILIEIIFLKISRLHSDAAHRIHPLAGLGLNLGMGDVKYLTKALEQSAFSGSKLNDLRYLRGYEKQSLRNNVPVMLGVHGLHRMYNTNSNLVILARTIGLKMAHKMAPLKVN